MRRLPAFAFATVFLIRLIDRQQHQHMLVLHLTRSCTRSLLHCALLYFIFLPFNDKEIE